VFVKFARAFRCPPNLGMTIGSRTQCRLNFERCAGKQAAGPSVGEKIVVGPPGFHFLEDRSLAILEERRPPSVTRTRLSPRAPSSAR
jgi:hypothetical protein